MYQFRISLFASRVDRRDEKTGIINLYVLMNTMGNCSVRRNCNLHFTKKARTWLERMVVSGRSGSSIPLLYHEGTLHTNIFWNETDTGEVVGSLVSGLLTDGYNTKRCGYGSLIDHVRTRFTNPSLLTSTDYRYQFNTYDALFNIGARGNNTATILRRGFADEQGNEGICMRGDEDDIFDACSIGSRKTVNQLASVLCTKPCHYFYTFTPNEKECVAHAPIDEWINGEKAMLTICARELMSDKDEKKYKQALRDSAASVKLRSWIEFSHMLLRYLQFSSESPLGCVDYLFARMEFQNDALKGILPHWHILLRLTETFDHENPPEAILDKIRGSVCDMFRTEDVGMWIAEGWISDISEVSALRQSVFAKCQHHCTTCCQIPLSGSRGNDNGDDKRTKCKAPNNAFLSSSHLRHTFKSIEVERDQLALQVYLKLGMIVEVWDPEDNLKFVSTETWSRMMCTKKQIPPARGDEGLISPINPSLFVMNPCVQNLQYTTGYLLSRYLAEYIAEVDKNNKVILKASGTEEGTKIKGELTGNTKILGVKLREEKNLGNHPTGRAISILEILSQVLQYPSVVTNLKFVFVPTSCMADRPVVEKRKTSRFDPVQTELDIGDLCPTEEARRMLRFPLSRQLDQFQKMTFVDAFYQPYSYDKVMIFSMRPPELKFLRHIKMYCVWFERDKQSFDVGIKEKTIIDRWKDMLRVQLKKCP
jgi:hypothetical protein